MIIGVDVGITGAITLYNPEAQAIECHDIPTIVKYTSGKTKAGNPKQRKEVDLIRLKALLVILASKGASQAVVEKIASRPNDGAIQAFKFGEVYGVVKASLVTLGFIITEVSSQRWKRHFNLIGLEKDAARLLAIEIFGNEYFTRKKDHNRADSALIACYGASLGLSEIGKK